MYDRLFAADAKRSRKAKALNAAMPYILDEYRDAYALERDGARLDIYRTLIDSFRGMWRGVQARFYPMPDEVRDPSAPPQEDFANQ